MRQGWQWLATAGVLLGLALLAWAAVRTSRAAADFARAEPAAVSGTGQTLQPKQALQSVVAAIALRPDQADSWLLRAQLTAFQEPKRARQYAQRAIRLDPRDWRNWRELGLIAYRLNDLTAAHQAFSHATRYDHGFDSHYQLGNLALLLGNEDEFWREMKAALAIAPPTRVRFVLQEALNVGGKDEQRLVSILPRDRAEVNAEAIRFLLSGQRPLIATAAWGRMRCQQYQRQDCRSAALDLINHLAALAFSGNAAPTRLIEQHERASPSPSQLTTTAMDIWNKAVARNLLDQKTIGPSQCGDGLFQRAWDGPAFSWSDDHKVYLQTVAGLAPVGNAVRIAFDGYEPEQASLFRQFVAVLPGATYQVSFASRRQVEGTQTGVELSVQSAPNHALDLFQAASRRAVQALPAALDLQWQTSGARFRVPKDTPLIELAFLYVRPKGQVRLHDPVLIGQVRLELVRQ